MNKQDKILVTGASGLIGSALIRLLISEGYDNLISSKHSDVDLTQQEAVQSYFYHTAPDYVFHLAAHVGGIAENNSNPAKFIYRNTLMQCNVFEAAKEGNVKKLLFPGSACAYPKKALQPIKEQDFLEGTPEPTNLAYAIAKINGIVMAQSYAKEYGMNVVLPMVANTYGPGDRSTHVIPDMMKRFRENKHETVFWGTGAPLREFIHADDVARAFLFLMQHYDSPEIINVGTMQEISIKNLAILIAAIGGYSGNISFDDTKPDGISRKALDSSRLRAMGWKPEISLDHGLKAAYDH